MTTVEQIEQAILRLPAQDFSQLADWFDQQRATPFDRQMEADAAAGRLDKLFHRLEAESAGQPDQPLDEFLHHPRLS